MTDEGAVAKEQLALCRLANAGNDSGDAGYQINNLSRADRKAPSTSQEISFSDSLLFDGGLAKDVQHTDKAFDGENIELRYGVSVAGEGIGGYTVTNFSRDCYILPGEAAQTFSFALTIWQDHARTMFKDILKRQLAGEFTLNTKGHSLAYLRTDLLENHHIVAMACQDPVMTDYTRFVICSPDTLIFLSKIVADKRISSKEDEPGLWLEQAEFPLVALPWIVRTIEDKFWRWPNQGGLSNDTLHISGNIAGEQLKIRYVPQCSDDGEKGIKLQNLSRPAVNSRGNSQSVLLPNKLLKQAGLLQILKDLCGKKSLNYPDVYEP